MRYSNVSFSELWDVRTCCKALTPARLDVNECAVKNGGCHAKRECTNTAGGMTCDDCAAGYVNDGAKGCKAQAESKARTLKSFGYKSCCTLVVNRGGTSDNCYNPCT